MSKAEDILQGLGGKDNVVNLEPCITRLRVQVDNPELVDEEELKKKGAFGVVKTGRTVQVVVGPQADDIAGDISELR